MTQSAKTRIHRCPISRRRVAELRIQCQREPRSIERHRQAVEEFLQAGLTAEALPLLRRLATLCPDDADVLSLLARVLADRNEHREAVERYRQVAAMRPESADAWHDLGVAACTAGEYATARDAFERKITLAPDSYETRNDLAVLYAMDRRYDAAADAYRRCLAINPAYEKGRQNALHFFWDAGRYAEGLALVDDLIGALGEDAILNTWRERFRNPVTGGGPAPAGAHHPAVPAQVDAPLVAGRKIAFVASSDTFLQRIVRHFAAHNDVRCVFPQSSAEIAEIMRWSDLTWFEWCDALVVQGSQLRKSGKTVCRLHSYEAFTDFPAQVNWRNVDRLILVNRSVEEILEASIELPVARTIIPNGVDPDRFPLIPRDRRGKKIAAVGYINYKKNPSLLLQTFKVLHDGDPEFELHIAGTHQDPRIKVYIEHLLPRLNLPVTFHGWVEDMPAFYAGMDYVISTSLFESFHYSIAEGMLSGCLPLIHSWKGADDLYPPHALFDTPAAAQAVVDRYRLGNIEQFVHDHRQHIIDRFNWPDRLRDTERLLHEVLMGEKAVPARRTEKPIELHGPRTAGEDFGCVSIVIPAADRDPSVTDAVTAALKQTYGNTEVVVGIPPGSRAATAELEAFADRVVVVPAEHAGLAAALNAALQASRGDYIAFCHPRDRYEPEWVETQVRRLAAADELGLTRGVPDDDQVGGFLFSHLMVRRRLFDEIGWFEEYAPGAPESMQSLASMWRRLTARSDVNVPGDSAATAVDSAVRAAFGTAAAADTDEVILDRWNRCVASPVTLSVGQRAADETSASEHMNVVFVAAADPSGQMAMWANALNRHTGLTARVLTHRQEGTYPSDLVMRRVLPDRQDGGGRTLMEVLADAQRAVQEADLIVFGVGLAPGGESSDHRLADADEQPFGTIHWPDCLRGKRCAAVLFGTPSVRGNLNWYDERFRRKGWSILTNDPVVHRWLPDARWIVPIWSPGDECAAAHADRPHNLMIVSDLQPGDPDGGRLVDTTVSTFVSRHPDVTFRRYRARECPEALAGKAQAHIGIDRIGVGTGTFGLDSLENSALGLINIVYCSHYTRALIKETIGADHIPWDMPATAAELAALLDDYRRRPEHRDACMAGTRAWYDTYWCERDLVSRVADVLCGL